MNFTAKIVNAFFHHDSDKDIIKALYYRIGEVTSQQPGIAKYIEARIKQFCEEHPHVESYKELALTIMKDMNQVNWNWNDVSRAFWAIRLIDDEASFQLSVEERQIFREEMIEILGERFQHITKHEWITMPLTIEDVQIPKVTWADVAIGAFIAFVVGRYTA